MTDVTSKSGETAAPTRPSAEIPQRDVPDPSAAGGTQLPQAEAATQVAVVSSPVATSPQTFDADGRERPRFVLQLPNDAQLLLLAAAFERGDFRTVRAGAAELARSATDPEVRAAALDLQRRVEPEPLVVLLLLLSVGLFCFLAGWAYLAH